MESQSDTSPEQWLHCRRCNSRNPLAAFGGCPTCGGLLEMAYALPELVDEMAYAMGHGVHHGGPSDPGIWRWHALLPHPSHELTLGEGETPLLPGEHTAREVGVDRLLLKYEGANPTGSFKDRFQAVSISMAKALGFDRVFCSSTGNHGLAAAAYARKAGLGCLVLLHEESPPAFDEAIRCHGATVARIPAAERDAMRVELVKGGWFPATALEPPPVTNPFGPEGYKTIAYEIVEQLAGDAPDAVIVPVGWGDGLYGMAKGFLELAQLGVIHALPRVYATQPVGADPLVRAYAAQVSKVSEVSNVARSPALSIREALSGDHGLRLVRETKGQAIAVDDAAIVRAAEWLADDGLIVDIASAASVAGAAALVRDGAIAAAERVVCLLTASGARWPRPPGYTVPGEPYRGDAAGLRRLIA